MTEVVKQAITGREDQGDRSRPEQVLAQFYEAFNARDIELAAKSWENSTQAVMDNPLGGISRGWDEIRKVYARLFSGSNRVEVEFWDYSIIEAGDSFVAIGRERGKLTGGDGTALDLRIRTSRTFRRSSTGGWRQVHHHGSIDEPDLLRDYQRIAKG